MHLSKKSSTFYGLGAVATLLILLIFSQLQTAQAAPNQEIYSDSLASGWQDWSWGSTRQFNNGSPVQAGNASLAVTHTEAWAGFYLRATTAVSTNQLTTLRFWLHGGQGGQTIVVKLVDGNDQWSNGITVTAAANQWTLVERPLADFNSPTAILGLVWQEASGAAQPTFYLDEIALVSDDLPPGPTPTPTATAVPGSGPSLTIDADASQRPISPHIYGMNFPDSNLASELTLPVARWGGNATTRYNWQLDVSNRASDWFFENIANDNSNIAALPDGSASDQFVAQNQSYGGDSLLTIPMIGWTPKSRSKDCGFSVSKYGAQQQTDPWAPDCGNGIASDGSHLSGNDPTDTSLAIDETFVQAWLSHLTQKYGTADNGGVRFYNLDNEPMLWAETHRDVHPEPTSYDEMAALTTRYGAAVKAIDPAAQTLGPVVWGWPAYFYSAADGDWWLGAPDRAAHGGMPFVPWYLEQMAAYEAAEGTRILDYLDLHYYPQQSGVALQGAGSAATQALRLRSTRALWDASYVDESWINEPVYLLPRMRDWVDAHYPGTKLAITEYNWGGLEDINGAVTQADVLGIFGREGLDLATLWDPPAANEPGAYAFRMYLNYDGQNGRFGETSVYASSSNQGQVAGYGSLRAEDGALLLMLINKSSSGLESPVTLHNFTPTSQAARYQYSADQLNGIVRTADAAVGNQFTITLPPMSISLLVLLPQTAPTNPPLPPAVTVSTQGTQQVALSWEPVDQDTGGAETAVSLYRIYRTASIDTPLTAPIATVDKNTTSWLDPEGVQEGGGTYFYTVTAINQAGESTVSNRVGIFGFPINIVNN